MADSNDPNSNQLEKTKRHRNPIPKIDQETIDEIIRLAKAEISTRQISKRIGVGRKRVRTILTKAGMSNTDVVRVISTKSKLDPYRQDIIEKVGRNLTTTRILREIRENGYDGGKSILTKFIHNLPGKRPVPRKRIWRRFETAPGAEMQVDWSPYRVTIGDKQVTVHAFAATLGYSRKTFVHFFSNEKLASLLEAHTMAFDAFGGVTSKIVYDNMTTVVLGTVGKDRKPLYNQRFLDFAKHYGFEIYLCRVRDPNRKGKDERFFWYMERDFIRGSSFSSFDELNARIRLWLDEVANCRVHGTTRRVPDEAWREEQPLLVSLPQKHYGVYEQESRRVGPDAVISVQGTPYTIPARLAVSREVQVRLFAEHFDVLDKRCEVGWTRRYVDTKDKGKLQINKSHYEQSPASKAYIKRRYDDLLLERFASLSPLVEGIRTRYKTLAHIHLKQLWSLASCYGDERFLAVAQKVQRCRRFDAYAVRRLLEHMYPMDDEEPVVSALNSSARLMLELGDVDSGSMDDYAHLDDMLPGDTHGEKKENK